MQLLKKIKMHLNHTQSSSKSQAHSCFDENTDKILNQIEMQDRRIKQYQIEYDELYKLWSNKDYDAAEAYGLKIINHDNWLPRVFDTMAKLYRRQKRYDNEIKILEAGIKTQKQHSNPGVATRNFKQRILRIYELQSKNNN